MFEIGKEYKRKEEIHGVYGGQGQGGISTPANHPVIFVFTSDAGEQHGYRDEFSEEGVFWYTGEGQVGDMEMKGGNKAILEHSKNNKAIHVFEYTRKAYVRYLGSAECLGYHEEVRPDREGGYRKVFVFHLDIDSVDRSQGDTDLAEITEIEDKKTLRKRNLDELRRAALASESKESTPKQKLRLARYRSDAIKLYVLKRSKGICEGCGSKAPFKTKRGPYLECHHLHRLADGGPDHPENVVAVCPNCHRRAHLSSDSLSFNNQLKETVIRIESSIVGSLY